MTTSLDGLAGRPVQPNSGGDASPAATRDADTGDRDRFGDLLRGDGGGGGREPDTHQGGAGDGQAPPSPFNLFGGGHAQAQAGQTQTAAEPAGRAAAQLAAIVDAVADRVLVSTGDDGPAGGEVRVQLKESVLPGTEVRVRHEGGRLVVEIVTVNADSLRFLDGQRDALCGHLQDRLKADVEVRVVLGGDGAEAGENGGRSRQQYVPADPEAEERE